MVEFCGKGGIRTLGTRKCTTVFETAPFNHSGTFPKTSEFKINTFLAIRKAHLARGAISYELLRFAIYRSIYNFPNKSAISIADIAASKPLLPAFVPARSIACSMESVVNTPNIQGTFVSIAAFAMPLDTSAAM